MAEGLLSLKKFFSAQAENNSAFQLDFECLKQGVIQCYSRKTRMPQMKKKTENSWIT